MFLQKNSALGLPISQVSFGGAGISGEGGGYGFGVMGEKESETLIKAAWEQGINLFDTAPIYGFGLSEERLGRYLPKEALVISKAGVDWHESKRVNMTNEPQVVARMFDESLKRLKRDFIDIYMIHWPDSKVDIRRPMEVLKKFQDAGKIKFLGLCNTNSDDLKLAQEIAPIAVLQSELNLFNQTPFSSLGQNLQDKFTMSWGTFDKGILTGRVTPERKFSKEDCRSWAPWWNKKEVNEKYQRTVKLKEILNDYNLTLSQFALHYNLSYFGVSTALIGFKAEGDILEVASSLQQPVMRERIEEVLKRWNN